MNLKKQLFLVILIIISVSIYSSADLTSLNKILSQDIAYAKEYLSFMEQANKGKDYLGAKKDLDMAISLANRINDEGEIYFRQARIKLEEFWVKASYAPLATTRLAYINAEEFTRKTLAKDLKKYLVELSEMGFNGVIVDTMRCDGYTLYPTSKMVQYRLLQGSDPIKELCRSAKELDLDLFLVMDVGFIAEGGVIPFVVSKHPDWVAISESGNLFDLNKRLYLNLSHQDVRSFYLDIAQELADYNIDGLLLRFSYPKIDEVGNDFSYDTYSRKLFEQQYGYDPLKSKGENNVEWVEWRTEQINSLVGQIYRHLNTDRKNTRLGAIVLADEEQGIANLKNERLLDWQTWIARGYIQYLFPQIASRSQFEDVSETLLMNKGAFLYYPLLVAEEDFRLCDMLCTLNEMQLLGGFALGNIMELDYTEIDFLKKGPLYGKTVSLHKNPWRALMLNFSQLEKEAPRDWVSDLTDFNDNLSKLVMAPAGTTYIEVLDKVKNSLVNLQRKADTGTTAFDRRMQYELITAERLLQVGIKERTPQGKKRF